MAQNDLKPILEKLGLRQGELAQLLNVSIRTVSLWAKGGQTLPGAVAGYLRLLAAADETVRRAELERLEDSGKRLQDGLYRIGYRATTEYECDRALAVLRNGQILGADCLGGAFSGRYRFDRRRGLNIVEISLEVPPDGLLISGNIAGPKGARIEVTCNIARADPVSRTTIDVAGQTISIELSFLGPLPN